MILKFTANEEDFKCS